MVEGVIFECWKLSVSMCLEEYPLMILFNKVPLPLVLVFDCNVLVIHSLWEITSALFYCCFDL